jgi:hypothetical protein
MTLYNFSRGTMEAHVDQETLTDEQAMHYLPQHPVAQSCYQLIRARGVSVLQALTEVLMAELGSGGHRKFIHVREGGRG